MATQTRESRRGHALAAIRARDLMLGDPISLAHGASVREALSLLTTKGLDAAPVINDAGRPAGVVSTSDILTHISEQQLGDLRISLDSTRVADIMTPVVISIVPEAPVERVISEMVAHKVQRLYVIDDEGVVHGVIRAMDVLSAMHPETSFVKELDTRSEL